MTGEAHEGLKLVVAWSPRRNLCSLVRDGLEGRVDRGEILAVGDDAVVVNTVLSADELRDSLRETLDPDEGLLVTEFEVWSGYGQALDSKWMLRRGH
jgi:hypothetical protein